ncbi:MAG: hypothetical protein M0P73_08900 [Syntrophobacterales bacterium]|jgi:hypothetical protein|nr:hypothetical protein [Syntrophobacterales bacterium]
MKQFEAFPEIEAYWQSLDDCQEELIELVMQAYISKTLKIEIEKDISPKCVDNIVRPGFIALEGKMLYFINKQLFLYITSHLLIRDRILAIWEDKNSFVGILNSLYLEASDFEQLKDLNICIIILLNNEYNRNVCKWLSSLTPDSKELFWPIYPFFIKALPYLAMDKGDLVEALERAQNFLKNDYASGEIFKAVEKLSSEQPEFAEDLYDFLILEPESDKIFFIPTIMVGLSHPLGLEVIWRQGLQLINQENPRLTQVGISALGSFDYSGESQKPLLEETLHQFERMLLSQNDAILGALAHGFGNLLNYTERASEFITILSEKNIAPVQYEISRILFLKADLHCGEDWFTESFKNLSSVKSTYQGIVQNIRHCLYGCLKSNPDIVISFIELWIENRDYGSDQEPDISAIFGNIIQNLRKQHNQSFEKLLTRWFNSDNSKLHIGAMHVIRELIVHERMPDLKLSKEVLDTLAYRDVEFIASKILGYIFEGEYLCSLLFSILQRTPNNENINSLVTELFNDYVTFNYPRAAREHLSRYSQNGTEVERTVASDILKQLDYYQNLHSDLPRLREFEPPERRAQYFKIGKHKKFSKQIQKGAEDKSVVTVQFPF